MIYTDWRSRQHATTFAGGLDQCRPARIRVVTMLAVIICLLVTMFVVKAGHGAADDVRDVCSKFGVWVRDAPANRPIRLLRHREKFKVIKISKHNEDWTYGYASVAKTLKDGFSSRL